MFRFCVFTLTACFVAAVLASPAELPGELKDWQAWVLHDHPNHHCPYQFNENSKTCEWSAGLELRVNNKGGEFLYPLQTFADGWVTLPGGLDFWPQRVMDSATPVVVIDDGGKPKAYLVVGQHRLTGEFTWPDLPRTLHVPPRAGLLQLQINQRTVLTPVYQAADRIWLAEAQGQAAITERDSLDFKVYRRFTDSNPALMETVVDIDVSGQEREISTGPLLLPGFSARSFDSDLPARIEKDGGLRVQVKAGRWQIRLQAHSNHPLDKIHFVPVNEYWPEQEIWVFAAQPQLRTVQLSGLASIDPRQTQLPEAWQNLPSYLAESGQTLRISAQHRGSLARPQSQLRLQKTLWLDFSGAGYTVHDQISGEFQLARLEVNRDYQLGRAEQGLQPLLVTRMQGSDAVGVEIRDQNLELTAVSRMDKLEVYPTSGWQADFNQVVQTLILPPGWSLFHASGADVVRGSWMARWSLWHIFLFLLIVVSLAKSFSWRLGGIAFMALLLTYHRPSAPLFIWLNFAALYALKPYVKGAFEPWFRRYSLVSFILCLILLTPFVVDQVRLAVYPQLEQDYLGSYQPQSLVSSRHSSSPMASMQEMKPLSYPDENVEEVVVSGIRATDDIGASDTFPLAKPAPNQSSARVKKPVNAPPRYDVGQKIQVGPGLPNWSWQQTEMRWSGPVTVEEQHTLFVIPPFWNRLGYLCAALLQMMLLCYVAFYFYREQVPGWLQNLKSSATALVISAVLVGLQAPPDANAQVVISDELLDELAERLLAEPDCLPDCSAIEALNLVLIEDTLALDLVAHSVEDMAFPLPARLDNWLPARVLVDGMPAPWLQLREGQLYLRLLPGRHQIKMLGSVAGQEQVSLVFLQDLHNVQWQAQGWRVNGVPSANQASQSLQLQRVQHTELSAEKRLLPDALDPFVRITREIHLGMDWRVSTTVQRIAPSIGAINLDVPLLAGEAPSSGNLTRDGAMQVSMAQDQQQFIWGSTLKLNDQLQLTASANPAWTERWKVSSSTLWHTEVEGIPALTNTGFSSDWVWLPWGGETVSIQVQRPTAIVGRHLSVDAVTLLHTVGRRTRDNQLQLRVRASQGSRFPVTLPPFAQFKAFTMDGTEMPISHTENQLHIPITPGEHQLQITWVQEQSIDFKTTTPALDLGLDISNIRLQMQLPRDRWLLFVDGPVVGPAVLFWGILLVVLVFAVILGRTRLTPLKTYQWVLLSIGVVTIDLYLFLLIAAWFIALYIRGRRTKPAKDHRFNLLQLLLIVFSFIALGAMLGSIPASLLSNPNMMLSGNGSHASSLLWYQDQSDGHISPALVFSLPILYYRIAMLLWSIWLAFALMRWIPWAWHQLNAGGFWFTPEKPNTASKSNKDKEASETP